MNEKIEALRNIYDYILNVNSRIEDISNDIRNGKNYQEIPNLVEGITYVIKVFSFTNDIHNIDLSNNNIQELVADMLEGFENSDFSLLADIMEFEFKPLFQDWKQELETVLSK